MEVASISEQISLLNCLVCNCALGVVIYFFAICMFILAKSSKYLADEFSCYPGVYLDALSIGDAKNISRPGSRCITEACRQSTPTVEELSVRILL